MSHGQKAWLVTWDWVTPDTAVADRLAAILRPRLSQKIVGEFVECLYALHAYTPAELALWARRPKENPYRARWHDGICACGHNPFLTAEYVHDLVVQEQSESGLETISYVLPAIYRFNLDTKRRELVREAIPESFKRTLAGPLKHCEIGR